MPRPGTRQQRGYHAAHDRERARLAPIVARGLTRCARCGQTITPGEPWDLGHNDDRTGWTGPEHASCNRSAGARTRGHARPAPPDPPPLPTRPLEHDEW